MKIVSNTDAVRASRPALPSAMESMTAESNCKGNTMADRDTKRKRPITCLETGETYDSAYRAAKELGFADSRNIFRSIQRGTCTQGLHFYYADAPKPAPGFFLPPNRPPDVYKRQLIGPVLEVDVHQPVEVAIFSILFDALVLCIFATSTRLSSTSGLVAS